MNPLVTKPVRWTRVGDVSLFVIWGAQGADNAVRGARHAGAGEALTSIHMFMVSLIMVSMGALFLIRGPSTGNALTVRSKFIAIIGTWSIIPLAALPIVWAPGWLLTAATVGLVAVYLFVFWALVTLRRSFSIFPEARDLVCHGPYQLVRHPLYSAHITCYLLICLPRLSLVAISVATLGIAGEFLRARHEERVLAAIFPDYRDYAKRTPRFVPHFAFILRGAHLSIPVRVPTPDRA